MKLVFSIKLELNLYKKLKRNEIVWEYSETVMTIDTSITIISTRVIVAFQKKLSHNSAT